MWRSIVLQAAIARQSALAARAWEDFGSTIAEEGSQKPDSCNSQLGDIFDAASEILLPLDVAWLAFAVLAVLVVLVCTQQLGLHVDGSSGPEKFPATQWYRAGFSSLTSHAAGIVGFVGFQKIVVARIVALSDTDTCDLWSLHNFLLYTTLGLSVVAVSASFVFLGVDYARRLAIDAAKQKGFRLVLKAKKLENIGIGLAIIALGGLMVLLYALVIVQEASQQKVKHIDHKWLLLDTVCGGGTVLLFYLNLRGLYQSPKVQFDATCHEADERITLEEFLEMHSVTVREGPSSLATVLERVAGEDLALLATRGTRRAILPNQRWAPLVHVICGLLLLGVFPLVVHLGANSLFANPNLEDLKALTGTVTEISESSGESDIWSWNIPTSKHFLFLNSEAAKLQVTPTYQHTSKIELCCPSLRPDCERERLNHSLIKFFKEPVVLSVPYSNSSADCNLTLHGLSSRSETTFAIRIEPKVQHHLCDCSLEGCRCCDGFDGELKFSNLSKLGLKQSSELLRNVCKNASCKSVNNTNGKNGTECACHEGYVGEISWDGPNPKGICTAAECDFYGSNNFSGSKCGCADGFEGKRHWNLNGSWTANCRFAECAVANSKGHGPQCLCEDGYQGNIVWRGPTANGSCEPASCDSISNSIGSNSTDCRCANGFTGEISWKGATPFGNCTPAPCENIQNSNREPGLSCKCVDSFDGEIKWEAHQAKGECRPATCTVPNSTKADGLDCECEDMFVGNISWQGAVAHGDCKPAPCDVPNSNKRLGPDCACLYGYAGALSYSENLESMVGHCIALPCEGKFSNNQSGPDCACADGYNGTVHEIIYDIRPKMWTYRCEPVACDVDGSTGDHGWECRCRDGFQGQITWEGPRAKGSCRPAPCLVANSNHENGTDCKCLDGYDGSITWKGDVPVGTCTASVCRVTNSDFAAGPYCGCLRGFYGAITWNGNQSKGQCFAIPKCSDKIIHAASLATDVPDSRGKLCRAGEQLVFHGHQCFHGVDVDSSIRWTSAHSVETGRCEWTWSSRTCGHAPLNESVPPLPLHCSGQPVQPRCDSDIRFNITSTGQLHCPNLHGNEPIVLNGTHLVEFQGRQCGYDLILWEFVRVPSFPSCRVKLSLGCGQEIGIHVPNTCTNMAQPASFVGSVEKLMAIPRPSDSNDTNQTGAWRTSIFLVKFFDDGGCFIEGSYAHGWFRPWLSDGTYLVLPGERGSVYLEKPPDFPDGSRFTLSSHDARLQLMTTSPLPAWWSFKFQQDAMLHGSAFNTDRLNACYLHLFLNGTCYHMRLGEAVKLSHTTESECPIAHSYPGMTYHYKYSTYGTQTYQSPKSCIPHAAHYQLELEIVDVPSARSHELHPFSSSSMDGECRTVVRYVIDMQKLPCNSNMMKMTATNGGRTLPL